MNQNWLLSLVAVTCWILVGCGSKSPYERGVEFLSKERDEEAAAFFWQSVCCKDRDRVESHKRLVSLYQEQQNDALLIWNLDALLRLTSTEKNNPDRKNWQLQLEAAKERYLSTLSSKQMNSAEQEDISMRLQLLEAHALRQKRWIERLTQENQELRRKSERSP